MFFLVSAVRVLWSETEYILYFQRFARHRNRVRIRTKASDWTSTYPPRCQIPTGWLLATMWNVARTWHHYWRLTLKTYIPYNLYSIYFKRLYILTRTSVSKRGCCVCLYQTSKICTKMTVLLCTMNKTLSRLHSTHKMFNISFLH